MSITNRDKRLMVKLHNNRAYYLTTSDVGRTVAANLGKVEEDEFYRSSLLPARSVKQKLTEREKLHRINR